MNFDRNDYTVLVSNTVVNPIIMAELRSMDMHDERSSVASSMSAVLGTMANVLRTFIVSLYTFNIHSQTLFIPH